MKFADCTAASTINYNINKMENRDSIVSELKNIVTKYDVDRYAQATAIDVANAMMAGMEGLRNPVKESDDRKPTNLSAAITILINELRNDDDYRLSWVSNIAMAFKDEMARKGDFADNTTAHIIHVAANDAAINFINQLIAKRL